MATVTSITAAKAEEIYNASITSAELVGTSLVFRTRGGAEFTLPNIKANALDAWPVGSIFTHSTNANPATLLGGGTWVRHGEGRVMVSQKSSDADFDTAGDVGGAKKVALTAENNGPHTHPNGGVSEVLSTEGIDDWALANGTDFGFGQHAPISVASSGSGTEHENMPPFIVVYVWRRTA